MRNLFIKIALVAAFVMITGCNTGQANTAVSDIAESDDMSTAIIENDSFSIETDTSNVDCTLPSKSSGSSKSSSLTSSSKDSQSNNSSSHSNSSSSSSSQNQEETTDFYNQDHFYVTWLNVWDGSTESWWSANDSSGVTIPNSINSNVKSLNWNSSQLRTVYMDNVKAAGVDVVIMDLTNGIRWGSACTAIRSYCKSNTMKFAVAINAGTVSDFEAKAKQIYESYASSCVTDYEAYFIKDTKPLLVAYVGKDLWSTLKSRKSEFISKFTLVWASGEDALANKWGWQSPAKDGPQESSEAMYVTSSVNWCAPNWSITGWRKSLAYLDYGFLLANKNDTKYVIVGAYDDIRERNGWMVMNTANASFNFRTLGSAGDNFGTKGLIMRDVFGNISTDSYYNRVKSWINGTAKAYVEGGIIKDGAYSLKNSATGKAISSQNPMAYNPQTDNGYAVITEASFEGDKANTAVYPLANGYQQYMFFYHLGNNEYRIVRICVGFSLEDNGSDVVVNWDSNSNSQRWILSKSGNSYRIINKATGKALFSIQAP